jgi:hypothetical protein
MSHQTQQYRDVGWHAEEDKLSLRTGSAGLILDLEEAKDSRDTRQGERGASIMKFAKWEGVYLNFVLLRSEGLLQLMLCNILNCFH